jgi:tetratricopeptide (TPR) repeat protein
MATIMTPKLKLSSAGIFLLSALLIAGCSSAPTKPTSPDKTQAQTQGAAAKPAPKPVDKGDPDARFKAALDLMKQGQTQDAETALTDLIKDFPQYSGPLTELGMIYVKSKRMDLAASAFAKAIANNSQNAVAYNWQGILFREANSYTRAEQSYLRALSINSNYANAHLNLGILYDVYLKRPDDALQQYKEYQRLGGADDLRVLVWVADLEKAKAAAATAPAAGPVPAAPAAASQPTATAKPKTQSTEKKP